MKVELEQMYQYECPMCGHVRRSSIEILAPVYCPICWDSLDTLDEDLEELYGPGEQPTANWPKITKLARRMNGLLDEIEDEIDGEIW